MKKLILIVLSGITVIGILLYLITSLWIGSDVRRYCKTAKKIYGGDCVTALSELLNDKTMPFRDRNNAVWALGQLGDTKALPYITKFYTGIIPEKESYENQISQHELEKALKLIQGGVNISAIIWRHNIK